MPSRNQKKGFKQQAEYLQKKDENKAKARALYKANREKKKASVRDSYKADPEKKASVRDSYKSIPKRRRPLYATATRPILNLSDLLKGGDTKRP